MSSKLLYKYRFIYFNVRGAGELCRLTLVASGAHWEDVRYPMALASTGFSYDPAFRHDADRGIFDVNMGSLPILQIIQTNDEKDELQDDNHTHTKSKLVPVVATLGQSHSIAKFVAAQHGMYGKDALEQAKIDALYESCRDIQTQWYRTKRKKGGKSLWFTKSSNLPAEHHHADAEASRDKSMAPKTLGEYCRRLEKAISASVSRQERTSESPWCMGGSNPSLADVAVYHLLATPKPSVMTGSTSSFFDGESNLVQQAYPPEECPRLNECISAFGELEAIQKWEKERPETFT